MTRNQAFTLTSLFYVTLFLGFGAHLPYWPVWLQSRGLSKAEIGTMLGLAIFARVLGSTLFPALADRYAIRRAMLAVMATLSALTICLHLPVESKGALMALTLLMGFVSAPLIPVGEALGMRAAQGNGFAYSHARALGSLAFLLMALGMGAAIDRVGPDGVLYTIAACLLLTALFGALHPGGGAAPGVTDRSRYRDILTLMRNRVFLLFAVSAALGQAAHGVYYAYSTLHWREAGFDGAEIGLLWSIGVAAEIALLFGPGHRIANWLGPVGALMVAALAGVIRWGAMALGPTGAVLWLLQAMHGLTFGLALLGTMAFVGRAIPRRLNATAQGVVGGLLGGLTLAVITMTAGALAAHLAPATLYLIALIPSAAALIAALLMNRLWDRRPLLD
ncbi:MAG: MFS transporter [Pseudomonadota bacterium]